MPRKYTNRKYLDALQNKVIVFDGAMGTSLQKFNLGVSDYGGQQYEGCIDYLVIASPQIVEAVHRSFLEVGVDAIETNTFRANPLTLSEYGLRESVYQINFQAAQLARKLADEFSLSTGQQRFVAGSLGPSGKLISMDDPDLSNISFVDLVDVFREQAIGLIEGGVDLMLIETSQDILEVKAAIQGVSLAFEQTAIFLPIQAQITLDTTGRMLLGTDIGAALAILEALPIDVIGLNCSTGPEHMRLPIQFLGENSILPVSCIPNAGLPLNVNGEAVYPLSADSFAESLAEFVEKNNINVVGGCCGTTPEHLRKLVKAVGDHQPLLRPLNEPAVLASATQVMNMHQEPAPLIIGERLNTQGSRKFKKIILDGDYESVLQIAQQQVDSGAHALDVCVALTERADEAESMRKVIKILAPAIRVPLVIDSTELDVLETALQTAPGRCLINSTNLEAGRQKADKIFALAKKYNAAVIVLTIDEDGMAKTAQQKLEITKRLLSIAVNDHGLRPQDLVVDALTFTLATGDVEFSNSAKETLDGIRLIKQNLPGILTSLGVSNVSFGLSPAARATLNSVMLYHAVQSGLEMAIVNPAQITPYAEIAPEEISLAEDLIFNKRDDALQRLISFYDEHGNALADRSSEQEKHVNSLPPEERLFWKIVHRKKDGLEQDIDLLLAEKGNESVHERAVWILNNVLLPAMKEVGDKFGSGELILPFVLQSAEVMKKSVGYLENFLEKKAGVSKGLIVLATVYGDVHDIGKNLVKTILVNNGYEVLDLGKQVPAETIISTAVERKANAIGLSALLVSTSKQMPLIVNELNRREIHLPVLIGGAAINKKFGRRILMTDSETFYPAGVFYCKDAFEGLAVMDRLSDANNREDFICQNRREAEGELKRAETKVGIELNEPGQTSKIRRDITIPTPKTWGVQIVRDIPLESVFEHLSLNELFRLSWGAKNAHGEEWLKIRTDFEERLECMKREARLNKWLRPQAVYGYFPVQSRDDSLLVYDSRSIDHERRVIEQFHFPRQSGGEKLCLADYFAPESSDQIDTMVLQVVTVGQKATQRFDELQSGGEYTEAYFFHGLAVQTAEATADYMHDYIRTELGFENERGKRYSWGYPAIPELEDHAKVFSLLPVEKELGMALTSAYQLVPEQSTAAIIVHHPQARYFNIGTSRISQLMGA
ncbi:MAG: methionine synthase [Chloroflexi bacterium 44-23]|nr:MAG: methionine synthase [Chloroflexi bacterium 44-23]